MLLVHACFDFQSWRPIRQFKEELSINTPFPGINGLFSARQFRLFWCVIRKKKLAPTV